jgi:hypothetical protein
LWGGVKIKNRTTHILFTNWEIIFREKKPTSRDKSFVLCQQMFSEGAWHELQERGLWGGRGHGTFKVPADAGFV